jgi:hypothetical protein
MAVGLSSALLLDLLAIQALARILQRRSPCQNDVYAEPPGFLST